MSALGRELWRQVEEPQGFAFISDLVKEIPDEEVLRIASGALYYTEETAKILRRFLKKYDQRVTRERLK